MLSAPRDRGQGLNEGPAVRVRSTRLDDDTPAAVRDTLTVYDLAIDFSHDPEEITAALQTIFEEAIATRRWARRSPCTGLDTAT